MTFASPGTPDTSYLTDGMRFILKGMQNGYTLTTRKLCDRIDAWMDAPSPKALDLNLADVARLIGRDLIEVDEGTPPLAPNQSTYRLTEAGQKVV